MIPQSLPRYLGSKGRVRPAFLGTEKLCPANWPHRSGPFQCPQLAGERAWGLPVKAQVILALAETCPPWFRLAD